MKELAGWVMDERGWCGSPDGLVESRFTGDQLVVLVHGDDGTETTYIPRAVIDALIAAGKP